MKFFVVFLGKTCYSKNNGFIMLCQRLVIWGTLLQAADFFVRECLRMRLLSAFAKRSWQIIVEIVWRKM